MMKLTKTGIGLLTRLYRSVLKKCFLINAGLFFALAPAVANASVTWAETSEADRALSYNLSTGIGTGVVNGYIYTYTRPNGAIATTYNSRGGTGSNTLSKTINILGTNYAFNVKYASTSAPINNTGTLSSVTGTWLNNAGHSIHNLPGTIGTVTGTFANNGDSSIYHYTASIGTINADFIGNRQGIYTDCSTLTNINGYFIGNSMTFNERGNNYKGPAIFFYDGITNENVNANFIGNNITATLGTDTITEAAGGAFTIYTGIERNNRANNITGDFIGNTINAYNYAVGGAFSSIVDERHGAGVSDGATNTIGTITGDFVGNTITGGSELWGGALANISSGNSTSTVISTISGDFVANKATGTGSGVLGGAIANMKINSGVATITNIGTSTKKANFVGNYATSTSSQAQGGAIYNSGTITNLYANFVSNYASGSSGQTLGGAIYNRGTLGISGSSTFTNNKANNILNDIYNDGGTISINAGTIQLNSGYNGTTVGKLNISSGAVFDLNENNGQLHTSNLGGLTNSGTFRLGIDIQHPTTGTTGTADLFNISGGSSGSILIDAINEIGGVSGRPSRIGTFTYQVLSGSGVTLAVDTALRNAWVNRKITTGSTTPDTIAATTNWGTTYYYRTPYEIINGTLNASGNNLVYTVSSINPGEDLEKMGDTLALVTTATNNASRIFSTTDATAEYLLSTNLGAVNAVYKNLSINGTVSGNNRSTLNLGNYTGFVLDSSDDNLSLSSMKVSGGSDYSVNLADSGSKLDVADVVMDSTAAPITGAGNVEFTGDNEINAKVLNTGTTTVSSGTTDFNDEVAGFTVSAPATVSIAADDITAETTNNGTLELEGGNVTTKLMGTGRMKLMSGNVRLLSSTPPATTGSLSFGSSSDYADSILTSSSAASTSDHALVTAGYLDNNYYMNYGDSMAKSFIKAANDNNFTTLNCVKEA